MSFHKNHRFDFLCFYTLMGLEKKRKSIWKYFWKQFLFNLLHEKLAKPHKILSNFDQKLFYLEK